MSALRVLKPKTAAAGEAMARAREWLSPLNLHWAGVGLLALVNLYILAQMGLLWHAAANHSPAAMAQQRVSLKTAEISTTPLRGLDAKLATATAESDRFYRDRLPVSYSEALTELGAMTKKTGARLTRVAYSPQAVLPDSPGQLTEVNMDATLSGDYRPLVLMLNSLERDKMFFVIRAVTLTGQQSGNVNLRLRLTTYLRPDANGELETGGAASESDAGSLTAAATGGPER